MASELDGPAYPEQNPIGDEGSVPVEVKMLVWVRRGDWEAEYSVDTADPAYQFEELFRDQFLSDCQTFFVEQGEMQNVTEITN